MCLSPQVLTLSCRGQVSVSSQSDFHARQTTRKSAQRAASRGFAPLGETRAFGLVHHS